MTARRRRTERASITASGNNRRDDASLPYANPRGALRRACPTCEAPIGHSCRRWLTGRVRGKETGGGYWRYLKYPHQERQRARGSAESMPPGGKP